MGPQITRTYLIQRLEKPRGIINPFSFGGAGLVNGGLSKEAMNLTKNIWQYDYMGSAEFEFGAVPQALQKIAQYCIDGKANTGKITLKSIVKKYTNEKFREIKYKTPKTHIKDSFYLCEKGIEQHVEDLLKKLVKNEFKLNLRESTNFKRALEEEKYSERYGGWLELDNGFMFFLDQEMYKNTLNLFGIKQLQ